MHKLPLTTDEIKIRCVRIQYNTMIASNVGYPNRTMAPYVIHLWSVSITEYLTVRYLLGSGSHRFMHSIESFYKV